MTPERGKEVRRQSDFKEVVLPSDRSSSVAEVVRVVRAKLTPSGAAIVLFTGPSGTGKALAAEVLASELRLALHKVDLSQIAGKFLAETEKNLSLVFASAEKAGAILFFDEADALFGRRSEVKDSHDRFANQEVQRLFERLEEHDGITIVAVSGQAQTAPKLLERTHIIVDFPDREATT